ncbi:MAG: CPBP family intramembrane metalloprotease [Oscillospiraceae bacterium]|nr:CPBP family intramembrane metalloprotease [Oscillospiraceae bacterium]
MDANSFDIKPETNREPKLRHGLLLLAVVSLLLIFVFSFAQYYWGLWGMVVTQLGIAAVTLLFALIFKTGIKSVFPMERVRVRHVPGALMMWGGAYLVSIGASLFIMMLFPGMLDRSAEINDYFAQGGVLFQIAAVAVLPGICEEMMHRGFILSGSSRISRTWVRVLYMGALFGAFHIDAYRFLATAILGMGLSYIMIRTKNIVLPMLLHFINNLISVLISSAGAEAPDAAAAAEAISAGQGFMLAGLGVIPIVIGWALLRDPSGKIRVLPLTAALTAGIFMFSAGMVSAVLSTTVYEAERTYSAAGYAGYVGTFDIPAANPAYAYSLEYHAEHHYGEVRILGPDGEEVIPPIQSLSFAISGRVALEPGEHRFILTLTPRDGNDAPETVKFNLRIAFF